MPEPAGTLTRRLTRVDALAIGIGSVIGTGIFRTTGEVLAGAGGAAVATGLWIAGAAVSALGALVYAGMASRVPEAGGPYAYVREAFGRRAAFIDGGLNAFLSIPARHAAAIGVIGEVLAHLLGIPRPRLLAAVALAALLAFNLPGVRAGAAAQRVFTTLKLVLVVGVVGLAITVLPTRPTAAAADLLRVPLATAVGAVWYSYLGWQDAVLLTEELQRPARDLRPVLLGTVAVVALAYLGVHFALALALGDGADARGSFPALALARRALGDRGESLMSMAILVSMVGGAAESLLVRPRVAFALARDGLAPRALARVNRGGTPAVAMLVHVGLVLALVLVGSFRDLLSLLSFTQAATGLLEAASAFRIVERGAHASVSRASIAVFVAANAGVCAIVGWNDPKPLGFALVASLVLFVTYPAARAGR